MTDKFLLQNVLKSDIGNITWTDHAPVSLTVGRGSLGTRANCWCNSILMMSHPEHKTSIQNSLKEFFELNAPSAPTPFMPWNAHKACIRGVVMKLSWVARKRKTQRINNILLKIKHLEQTHKQRPTPHLREQLNQARLDLRSLLLCQHLNQTKSVKANFYHHRNKAGKLLVQQLRVTKTKIIPLPPS